MVVSYYLIIISSLFFFYVIGKIISSLFLSSSNESNYYYRAFVSLIIGLFSVITVFAILKTRFNTVLIVLLLLGILYFILNKNKIVLPLNLKLNFKEELIISFLIIGFSLLYYVIIGNLFFEAPYNRIPFCDNYYYARLSYFLNDSGVESSYFYYDPFISRERAGASPYHYPELWLTAVYINFFNVQPLISHVIFVHIILAVILTIGIIALSEEIDKRIIFKILGILSLFFGGIVIFSIIPQTKFYIDYRSIIFPKFIIISLFFVWFILLFLKKSRDLFYPLLALPIINITLAPVIFTSIILYLLVISIIYKNFVNQLKPIILTIFFALCIWIFYFIQKKIEIYGLPVSEIIKINKSQPLQILNVFVASFIIYFSVFIWYFIPGIFIYYKNRNRELKDTIWYNIFLFGFIILFSGSFFWAILNPLHDSNQFYVLPVYFFSNILISLLFLLYLKKSYNFGHIVKKLFYLYLLFIIFINIYNIKYNCVFFKMRDIKSMYSKEYIDKIFAVIKCEDEIPNIGTIYSRIDIYYSFDAQVTITYLPPIDNMIPFHNTVNLNSPYDFIYRTDSYKIIKRSENIINNNLFIKYLKKENYNEKNIDELLRIRFIKENNIKYLVLKKGYKLPPIYDEIVKEQYYDNITGENFVILSY